MSSFAFALSPFAVITYSSQDAYAIRRGGLWLACKPEVLWIWETACKQSPVNDLSGSPKLGPVRDTSP